MVKEQAEQAQSVSQLSSAVGAHLQTLDLAAASAFLAGLADKIDPLRERYRLTREELLGMVNEAAAASEVAQLAAVNDRLVDLACRLFQDSGSARLVHQACTMVRAALVKRTLELARLELRSSSTARGIPMALFSTGSDGRQEQSLFAEQAYFFVYQASEADTALYQQAADGYFEKLGSLFSERLDQVGIARRSGGIMPFNAQWRGSQQQWQRRVRGLVRYANEDWTKNVLDLIVLSDARYLSGDPELGAWFGPFVLSTGQNTPQAIINMARVASAMPLANGILRRFAIEGEGEHKGELNLKLLAWKPLVICVEVLAVRYGVEETSTLKRLDRLQALGCLTPKLTSELAEAFRVISGLLIMQQIKKHDGLLQDENYLNPYQLTAVEREGLSRAIGSIQELQGVLKSKFSLA